MVHSGYEASAVDATFGSLKGLLATAKATLFGGTYRDEEAMEMLEQKSMPAESLVQVTIGAGSGTGGSPVSATQHV
jgi:hypothetical protein